MHTQNPNTGVGVPSLTQKHQVPNVNFTSFFFCPLLSTLLLYHFSVLSQFSLLQFRISTSQIYIPSPCKLVKTKIVLWEITLEINIVIIKWFQLVSFRLGFYKYNFILQVWGTIIGLEIQFYRNSPHRLYRIHYLYKMNTFRNY